MVRASRVLGVQGVHGRFAAALGAAAAAPLAARTFAPHGAPLAAPRLRDGQWHHVAATYDGTSIRLYADGGEIGNARASGPIDTVSP